MEVVHCLSPLCLAELSQCVKIVDLLSPLLFPHSCLPLYKLYFVVILTVQSNVCLWGLLKAVKCEKEDPI